MATLRTPPVLAAGAWTAERCCADRNILIWALTAAVGVHLLFFLIHLPERDAIVVHPPGPHEPPDIWRSPLPPPPKPDLPAAPDAPTHAPLLPVPFPVAAAPEPMTEASPEIHVDVVAVDAPLWVSEPLAPTGPPGPRIPGSGDVTHPTLIPESKVTPQYPELPRRVRIESKVVLRAVILADGSVGEIEVLRCDRPELGFEEAAIEAIAQWRYEPARQRGKPVDVYFTVVVDFDLH